MCHIWMLAPLYVVWYLVTGNRGCAVLGKYFRYRNTVAVHNDLAVRIISLAGRYDTASYGQLAIELRNAAPNLYAPLYPAMSPINNLAE